MQCMYRSTILLTLKYLRTITARKSIPIASTRSQTRYFSSDNKDEGNKKDLDTLTALLAKPGKAAKFKKITQPFRKSTYDENLQEAVQNVAKSFPAMHQDKVSGDLLKKLQEHKVQEVQQKKASELNYLFAGIRVERSDHRLDVAGGMPISRHTEKRLDGAQQETKRRRSANRLEPKLFEGDSLHVFDYDVTQAGTIIITKRSLFEVLAEEQLKRRITYPAATPWEEQMRWTKDGKLWSFPIDNEQGLEAEQKVPFTDHIFFDELLKDFPLKGPLRHFMELVCIGLSKNAFVTVQQKHEHIKWYANYFKEKQPLIDEVLANSVTVDKSQEPSNDKDEY